MPAEKNNNTKTTHVQQLLLRDRVACSDKHLRRPLDLVFGSLERTFEPLHHARQTRQVAQSGNLCLISYLCERRIDFCPARIARTGIVVIVAGRGNLHLEPTGIGHETYGFGFITNVETFAEFHELLGGVTFGRRSVVGDNGLDVLITGGKRFGCHVSGEKDLGGQC